MYYCTYGSKHRRVLPAKRLTIAFIIVLTMSGMCLDELRATNLFLMQTRDGDSCARTIACSPPPAFGKRYLLVERNDVRTLRT